MTSTRAPLHVNGKWLAHELSGTERYAEEIVSRLVRRVGRPIVLHLPADAAAPDWAVACEVRRSRWTGQVFEQLLLPLVTAGAPLLSVAGPAPVLKRRQLVALHDASVFALGSTYTWTFRTWYRSMYRLLSRTARVVVTVSHFSARELAKAVGVSEQRYEVVPNGAEHLRAEHAERSPARERPYVLMVGGNIPHKNTRWAVRALRPLGIDVVVVGKVRPSRQFADEGGPEEGAEWVGRVSDEELRDYYANALCLVFPSLYEGFGIPVLEAQAAGCAVVTSTDAALPEVAGDGALYFSTDDPEQLRDAVRLLAADPDERARLVQRGAVNLRRYSWEASAESMAALVDRL